MVQILVLPLSNFVILGKNNLYTSQFPHKEIGFPSTIYVIELHEDKMTKHNKTISPILRFKPGVVFMLARIFTNLANWLSQLINTVKFKKTF